MREIACIYLRNAFIPPSTAKTTIKFSTKQSTRLTISTPTNPSIFSQTREGINPVWNALERFLPENFLIEGKTLRFDNESGLLIAEGEPNSDGDDDDG